MKTPVTMRLSDEAIAALEHIAKHYGIDKTAAATFTLIEWSNVLREREREAQREIGVKEATEPRAVNSSSPP